MTHLPECPLVEPSKVTSSTHRVWRYGCICDELRACEQRVQKRVINLAVNALMRVPKGAVMEIACSTCNWDYGYEDDLAELFGAYTEHDCPNTEEERK